VGDKTAIEWTDATWNPVTGCDRTSPGCDHCYALKMAARLKKMGSANYQNDGDPRTSGPGFGVTCHPHMLDQPLRWKKPRRIFVNSMSDLFHPDVPDEFIAQVFAVMACAPQHTFQVLTKRPQRMAKLLSDDGDGDTFVARVELSVMEMLDQGIVKPDPEWPQLFPMPGSSFDELLPWPRPNVWLGVSIESDAYTFRADHLRATPAAVRFISAEPLLGPLPSLDLTGIDWLIVGGESGPGARPMHPDWVRDLRPVPSQSWHIRSGRESPAFFFKQWGEWAGGAAGVAGRLNDAHSLLVDGQLLEPGTRLGMNHMLWPYAVHRVGKHAAGRTLDGRTWDEMPEVSRE
jgi:protein gp37